MKRLKFVLWVAVATMTLAACGSGAASGGSGTGNQYRILFVGGLTGPQSNIVGIGVAGMKAAVASINESGGINGRQIAFDARDSQGDPTKAVTVLQQALDEGNPPDVVVPSPISAEALAMVPLLSREKIVSIGFAASPLLNDPEKYPFHYQVSTNSAKQLVGLAAHVKSMGVTKLGVLTSQDEYGNGVLKAAQAALDGSGIQVVGQQFPPTDVDLSVSYSRMLAENPGAVLLDVTGTAAPRLMQARVQAGGTTVPTILGTGMVSTANGPFGYASPEANADAQYLVFAVTQFKPEAQRTPVFNDFYKRLGANGPITQSLTSPALGWDNIRIVAAAASKPGATESPEKMQQALQSLDEPEGYWLTQKKFAYTAQVHTATPTADDFPYIPAGPLDGGMYRSATP